VPTIDRANRKYQILGIHGGDVRTVSENVARVRMYIGGEEIDEDFPLPREITVEEQLDEAIQTRIAHLKGDK